MVKFFWHRQQVSNFLLARGSKLIKFFWHILRQQVGKTRFHAVKNFTTAEGGASTWKPIDGVANAEIYKFYQLLSLHGQNKDALAKTNGYYHATNEGGYISWYDFTKEIYRQAGLATAVLPVTTAEYGLSKARRPFNSRLDKSKLKEAGFIPLPDWKDALARYLKEAGLQNGPDSGRL